MEKINEAAVSDSESAGRFLIGQVMSYTYPAALRAAVILGVADHLADGPKTAEHLALATEADPQKLYRILRLLATREVFREDEEGRFELTTAAELLRTGVPLSVRKAILHLTSKAIWVPVGELAASARSASPSFEQLFDTNIWEYWGRDLPPEEAFYGGQAAMSEPEILAPLRNYEFPQGATVVDVGGGYGTVLLHVLRQNPTLRGILFDQEHVLPQNRLDELGDDSRWELAPGDFFKKCPQGDVYLIKYIMHDWNDEQCVRILRNCRQAMAPDGRVVVFDPVIPPGNEPHTGKLMDMILMAIYPGCERTEEQFRGLMTEAGLRLTRVINTESYVSIVEAVPA